MIRPIILLDQVSLYFVIRRLNNDVESIGMFVFYRNKINQVYSYI